MFYYGPNKQDIFVIFFKNKFVTRQDKWFLWEKIINIFAKLMRLSSPVRTTLKLKCGGWFSVDRKNSIKKAIAVRNLSVSRKEQVNEWIVSEDRNSLYPYTIHHNWHQTDLAVKSLKFPQWSGVTTRRKGETPGFNTQLEPTIIHSGYQLLNQLFNAGF